MEHTVAKGKLILTASEKGAELTGLRLGGQELIWDAQEVWPRHAPVCFPWCGAVEEKYFLHHGQTYEAPQHGFIRDVDHTLTEKGEDHLTFRLEWTDTDRFPWPFHFETRHQLTETGCVTTCAVTNTGSEAMPVQLGFHPGFQCPFVPGTALEEYRFRFESGKVVLLTRGLFDNDSIAYSDAGDWVRLEHGPTGKYIQVDTAGFPVVLLWSKTGVPGFVCIEPWVGYPGPGHDLSARPHAQLLPPGETLARRQKITLAL